MCFATSMKMFISKSIADTAQFALEFLAGLSPHAHGATMVGLYGDLGSGKTTFVQQVSKTLGIHGSVQSPTFVIMKRYKITSPQPPFPASSAGRKGGVPDNSSLEGGVRLRRTEDVFFKNLIHIDAYRLDTGADLQKLGWDSLISNPQNLILIEWADRVADILPPDHLKLHFEFVNDTTRKIALE